MCGIVGYVGNRRVVPLIMESLKRLEYRGYDSAGIATAGNGGGMQIRRAQGKLRNLEEAVRLSPIDGTYGVGHTRWATHGCPSENNAHPHRDCSGRIVVVHNGIIENFTQLKRALEKEGHHFRTETDTEAIAHLIEKWMSRSGDGVDDTRMTLQKAVACAIRELRGSFALGVISEDQPDTIVAARNGPPAIVGLGSGEYFLASDLPALLPLTRDVQFLNDGDLAVITLSGVQVTDFRGNPRGSTAQHVEWDPVLAEKGGYAHYMLKEIFEQPRAVHDTIRGRIHRAAGVMLDGIEISDAEFRSLRRIHIVACGTSYYAGLAARAMIEAVAKVPTEVECASEYRYAQHAPSPDTLVLLISQSGETADTIAAQREAKARGHKTISVCNVIGSMLAREADGGIYTHAGPEIGVASTKAFTAQLAALYLLATFLAQKRGALRVDSMGPIVSGLSALPHELEIILGRKDLYAAIAHKYAQAKDVLFLGRGIHYATALEGALKLKEIAYVHAEAVAAGEMKHGTNALITDELPVVVVATRDPADPASVVRYEKTLSNLLEVKARAGQVIAVANDDDSEIREVADDVMYVPGAPELLSPILEILPLQLFAYCIALERGCDIDQPRNLAKSVTVE